MRVFLFYCVVFAFLLLSCARQIAPSGGPDDKTPPAIRATTPAIGTVGFPRHGSVSFLFSEWIDQKSAEACVSIFPPPPQGIKIKAYGKTMTIKPVKAFSESTTYHIECNMSLKDLHGNSVGTPYHFFFSTGTTIDSGKAFGCIVSSEKLQSQPKISLFAENNGRFPDTSYYNLPSYVVQTDSLGNFSFDHIRKGSYRIIGYIDPNNDNKLQPGSEQAFASIERSISLDTVVGPVSLFPVTSDTLPNRIISLKPLTDRILIGTWAHSSDRPADSVMAKWRILRLDSARSQSTLPAIQEYIVVSSTARFAIKLSDTMTMAPYMLAYCAIKPLPRGKTVFFCDSIRFNGTHLTDTTKPMAQSFFPTATAELKPRIKLVWSKPVFAAASRWIMADSLKDTVKLTIARGLSDSTIFTIDRPLKPDRIYRLRLPDTLFSDLVGHHPGDTAFGKYSVRAISAENICFSLSGRSSCPVPKMPQWKWLFLPLGGTAGYVSRDSAGSFRFDSIPAGKGRIASFIDFNGDNAPTPGNLFPWRKPEPYRLYPDTIEARARWDIEGIVAPACEECNQKNTIPVPPPAPQQREKNAPDQKGK
jgi:hypothetical protein